VARLLRQDVTDPRVGLVTLTRADVAPDLTSALIFWSALDVDEDPERIERCQAGLESAAHFLRHRAAGRLPFKRMPELRFRYDPSLALGARTLSVLREVARDSDPSDSDPSGREREGPEAPGGRGGRGDRHDPGEGDDGAQT